MTKKMKKFLDPLNLESITVHLVTLFDVFLVYETKFIVTAGKMGGDSTLGASWGNPQAVPDQDQMGPGAPEKLGARSYLKL